MRFVGDDRGQQKEYDDLNPDQIDQFFITEDVRDMQRSNLTKKPEAEAISEEKSEESQQVEDENKMQIVPVGEPKETDENQF